METRRISSESFQTFPMRDKKRYRFILIFLFFSLLLVPSAHARRRYYNLHRGPGMKFRIVGRVRAGEKLEVIEEKAGWVKVRRKNGKVGWLSQRVFQRVWKTAKRKKMPPPSVNVVLKFQNIPEPCVELFEKSLGVLKKHLMPVGDDNLELVVSAVPRLRSYYLFLTIDFNPTFYRRTMKRFSQPETIDLLPFNPSIWALRAYKQSLLHSLEKQERPECSFVKRLAICLVLRRLSGEEVILKTVEDGVYIYFSPVLIFKKSDGQSFRIMSVEPKKVGLLSAFALPYPLGEGGVDTDKAAEVYRFFRKRK